MLSVIEESSLLSEDPCMNVPSDAADSAALEYRAKYRILKNVYETRVRQLSDTVRDTCEKVLSSSEIAYLSADAASAMFIPGHIVEIFNAHLQTERESYIHESVARISDLQMECDKKDAIIAEYARRQGALEQRVSEQEESLHACARVSSKLSDLQSQYHELDASSRREVEQAQEESRRLEEVVYSLKSEVAFKAAELALVSNKPSTMASAVNESQASRSSALLNGIVEELREVRSSNASLASALQQREREVTELREEVQRRAGESMETKRRTRLLMSEVETILRESEQQQDAVVQALQRRVDAAELGASQALERRQAEAAVKSSEAEELSAGLREARRELTQLQDSLSRESRRSETTHQRWVDAQQSVAAKDKALLEKDSALARVTAELAGLQAQYEAFKHNVIQERRILSSVKESEATQLKLENRLMYQNAMRHSYTIGDTSLEEVVRAMRIKQDRLLSPRGGSSRPSYKQIDDELRALRVELSECKERAMSEHRESSRMLEGMKLKFDKLLSNHEDTVSSLQAASERVREEEGLAQRYQACLLGVLTSLVTLGLISDTMAREISSAAKTRATLESVYTMIGDQVNAFVVDLNDSKREVEALKVESRRISAIEASMKQMKKDHAAALELSRTDAAAQIQSAKEKMRELKVKFKESIQERETLFASEVKRLKGTFKEELDALRRGYEARMVSVSTGLETEHRRRREAESLLAAKEDSMRKLFSEHDERLSSVSRSPAVSPR